jgi:hypothetical protein
MLDEITTEDVTRTPAQTPKRPGRPKGSKNRVTAEIKSIAAKHGKRAIREMASIAFGKAENESSGEKQLRVRCMENLLDRGFGKPVANTELTGKDGAPLAVSLLDWMRGLPH